MVTELLNKAGMEQEKNILGIVNNKRFWKQPQVRLSLALKRVFLKLLF